MRFILKCAFWLGLVAFLLPFGTGRGTSDVEMSWLGAAVGLQEAVQDLSGFCDRAPRACEAGREAAVFAGERIGDGLAIAYAFVDDHRQTPAPGTETADASKAAPSVAPLLDAPTDPVTTGTLAVSVPEPGLPLPRAYMAPRRGMAEEASSHAPPAVIVVPTPAPRG